MQSRMEKACNTPKIILSYAVSFCPHKAIGPLCSLIRYISSRRFSMSTFLDVGDHISTVCTSHWKETSHHSLNGSITNFPFFLLRKDIEKNIAGSFLSILLRVFKQRLFPNFGVKLSGPRFGRTRFVDHVVSNYPSSTSHHIPVAEYVIFQVIFQPELSLVCLVLRRHHENEATFIPF